jgi:hypothetical protein
MASVGTINPIHTDYRLLAGLLLALLLAAAPVQAQAPTGDQIVRHFEQFALTTFGPQEQPAVVKWDRDAVVLLDGRSISLPERRVVTDTLSEIAQATGHKFRIAQGNETATILLGFIQPFGPAIEGRYRDIFNRLFLDPLRHIELLVKATADGKANCVYRPAVANFRVIGGLILVKPGLPEAKLRKCLSVFMAKMAGLLGNTAKADAPQGSGLDLADKQDRYNALDREIMRLLYLKELTSGMRRDAALAIIRKHLR